jgi:DNA ligase (NAD+)
MQDIRNKMQSLIEKLDEAAKAYYKEDREIMSNMEYDALYDELTELEKKTGFILSNSPTQKVGYEVAEFLPKQNHASPMLSLNKTKSVEDLESWLGDNKALLSWKLDGLTIVLRYNAGKLVSAVTRGNGVTGEVITGNAYSFTNVPVEIDYKKELVVRGEAVISYPDFEKINAQIEDVELKYKNPRNLCSGSVRQLDPKITKQRHVRFVAFNLMDNGTDDLGDLLSERFIFLHNLGFEVVEYVEVDKTTVAGAVADFEKRIVDYKLPSDGLVLGFDDLEYGKSLGSTEKFPRNAIAFKWQDEIAKTTLREIEWSPSRTGLINPIALFDPVELEGTTVSRAGVHTLSILESLQLGVGDTITVYKANMIIPQIADNLTKSGTCKAPKECPACKEETIIKQEDKVKMVYCPNPKCPVKRLKNFVLAVSRNALDIDGLSEMTLEKFLAKGYIEKLADLYKLSEHKDEIVSMEGFGLRSYEKLIQSLEKSRHSSMPKLIYALGIPGIGRANAKTLSKYYDYDIEKFKSAKLEELKEVEGIGNILASLIVEYLSDEENIKKMDLLLQEIELIDRPKEIKNSPIKGKTFVVTGSVESFMSRKVLREIIEARGAKMGATISSHTDYLINNDSTSNSTKNKKAKELGVKIITEAEFRKLLEE